MAFLKLSCFSKWHNIMWYSNIFITNEIIAKALKQKHKTKRSQTTNGLISKITIYKWLTSLPVTKYESVSLQNNHCHWFVAYILRRAVYNEIIWGKRSPAISIRSNILPFYSVWEKYMNEFPPLQCLFQERSCWLCKELWPHFKDCF